MTQERSRCSPGEFPTVDSGLIPGEAPGGRTFRDLNNWCIARGTTLYQQCCLLLGDPRQRREEELLSLARAGAVRPTVYTTLGERLRAWTSSNRPTYRPKFDKTIRALRPDWFVNTASEAKEMLLRMAAAGAPRPKATPLAIKLGRYTSNVRHQFDAEFDREIKKLRPDWFFQKKASQKKQALFELATDRTQSKPHKSTKLGSSLAGYTRITSGSFDPAFNAKIRAQRPDWFSRSKPRQREAIQEKKALLLQLAASGASRPNSKTTALGAALKNYTTGSSSDPEFDAEIRAKRPDWFGLSPSEQRKALQEKKVLLLQLAASGAPRPDLKTVLGRALKTHTHVANCDSEFDAEIRRLAPEWFRRRS